MSLVYLDTSHLSRLAVVLTEDPRRFSSFIDTWRSREHSLAFTRYHLFELRQHADPAVRAARYSVLEHLLPIRTDIPTLNGAFRSPDLLSAREIIAALLLTGEIDVSGDDFEEWAAAHATGLPCRIDAHAAVQQLRTFDDPLFGSLTRIMKSAFESEAEAQRLSFEAGGSSPRLRELPSEPIPSDQVQDALSEIERALASEEIAALLNQPGFNEEDRRRGQEGVDSVMEQIRSFLGSAEKAGMRAAYGEFLGLEGDLGRNRRRIDVLSREALWARNVLEVIRDVLGLHAEAPALSKLVALEDCPGTWLANNVRLEIQRDESDPDPSNGYDLEHLGHLPYVHRFFTDKRIANYVRQVLNRKGVPEHLRGMGNAEAIPNSIDDLEKALSE